MHGTSPGMTNLLSSFYHDVVGIVAAVSPAFYRMPL
jgi:hypothetical protein